ncbi:hypothetical protein GQ457_14G001490 [Hibiscus cannabinus]
MLHFETWIGAGNTLPKIGVCRLEWRAGTRYSLVKGVRSVQSNHNHNLVIWELSSELQQQSTPNYTLLACLQTTSNIETRVGFDPLAPQPLYGMNLLMSRMKKYGSYLSRNSPIAIQ